jgi:hypothetical protein
MTHATVTGFLCAASLGAAALAASAPVMAQSRPVPAIAPARPVSSLTPKVAPSGELLAAADALGMVRGMGSNVFDAVNRVQFTVQGTEQRPVHGSWQEFKTTATMFINYHQAASRVVIDRVDAKGAQAHSIEVVAGPYAWNEESPGVGGTPAMDRATDRARDIWLTPQGLIYQAELAGPDGVKVGRRDGKTTLGFAIHGEPVTVTLGADHRPEYVEATIKDRELGRATLTVAYAGYKDFDYYGIFFPSHIVAKVAGHTALDANVTAFLTNTYFLFPKPDPIAKLAARAGN